MSEKFNPPGWYVDGIETNLVSMIDIIRTRGTSVVEVANAILDPTIAANGEKLTPQEHMESMALSLAIMLSREARTTRG